MISDNFSKIFDKELQLLNPNQNRDVKFWQEMANIYCKNELLEIACGSGRLSLPLIESEFKLTGFDNSINMLNVFKQNAESKNIQREKYSLLQADMGDFKINKKFDFAFIGYFAFQILLNLEDQIQCIENIYDHLLDKGVLGIDIYPAVCEGGDVKEKEFIYSADNFIKNSTVEMFTSYTIDRLNLIKHWTDDYKIISKRGRIEYFSNKISLKECSLDYMKLLLEKTGFEILHIYGGFDKSEVRENSENIIYICQKR
ncbi:MAG: class I SAM-dependent methyltransferase [Candidatus Cloacimonetes bacterium]|nr:class I SAM-dependent methyltransferase [Candidatus Cloacimonadota bacterium]